jgi:hypothetical protein
VRQHLDSAEHEPPDDAFEDAAHRGVRQRDLAADQYGEQDREDDAVGGVQQVATEERPRRADLLTDRSEEEPVEVSPAKLGQTDAD